MKKIVLCMVLLTLHDTSASTSTSLLETRKRFLDDLNQTLQGNTTASTNSAPVTRAQTSVAATPKKSVQGVSSTQAVRPHQGVSEQQDSSQTASTSSTVSRSRSIIDPQAALKLDISTLLGAFSASISTETRARVALYIATCLEREEVQKRELDDFTGKLTSILQQLSQIKDIMNQQPIVYRAFRLPPNHTCCGKEVIFVQDLLNEVESAISSHQWGRFIHTNEGSVVRGIDQVNEDAIAGSWIDFLDARLAELEGARSMQNYLERSSTTQVQTVLTNRILQVRELCLLLRETALNKKIGLDYRKAFQELLTPATSSSDISTSTSVKKRRV